VTTPQVELLLAERHRDRFGRIQQQTVDRSTLLWDRLGDWTSADAAARWAGLWLPVTDAGVAAAGVATDGYFAAAVAEAPLGVAAVTAAELRGVADEDYARRPLAELYRRLGEGQAWGQAFSAARSRLSAMAATDVSLGQRRAAQDWAESGRIVGYRRTLSGASCGLCAVASTQRYHSKRLMPIHGNCDCGVAPIKGGDDPGQVINEELLDRFKEQGPSYWERPYAVGEDGKLHKRTTEVVRGDDGKPVINPETGKPRTRMALGEPVSPKVADHGELGPVLVAPGDDFLSL
jgi:hypothetical protein